MSTTVKSTYWSITINNPTEQDDENIRFAHQKGWKLTGQKEAGENGTIHYQAMLHTPNQTRFSAVKKLFPRAHIEIAKNPIALRQYVEKSETRIGDLPEQSQYYPSLSTMWELITQYYTTAEKWNLDLDELYGEYPVFRWYSDGKQKKWNQDRMPFFDEAVNHLIEKGYHIESIAANPQTRSAWKLYAESIILRSYKEIQNRANNQNAVNTPQEESSDEENQVAQIPTTPETSDDPYA